ncbi:MAG: carboxypeptidase M32 [Actinomycetota bacterium]
MTHPWEQLLPRLDEMADLRHAATLMHWDQSTKMPPKGAHARARALSSIQAIMHDRLVDPEVGTLLGELEADDSIDTERAAHVRILRRDYDRATKVPRDLVREIAETEGLAYQAWIEAKPASDFSMLEPHLTKLVALKKEQADAIGYESERYDALLDDFEPGMKTAEVESLLTGLVLELKPIADAILANTGPRPDFLSRRFDEEKQISFCEWLIDRLGYDMRGGRLDRSPHPFTIHIGRGDVRQTIWTRPKMPLSPIYAAIHETGHALYDQGIPDHLVGLPAGNAPSFGMHESQSRLWENQVGRGRTFTEFMLPHLKERFPEVGMITPDEFYLGVNYPQRTLIRVEADELTYNLHIVLRFELELALMRDELEVSDLPDAWDAGMEKHLGLRPESQTEGVLQDMHWSVGSIGYFPTYTLGTLYAAAFFAAAEAELGPFDDGLRAGETGRLLAWLRDKIHRHAYIYEAKDLGARVTGGDLTVAPFLDYLKKKYREIYSVSF